MDRSDKRARASDNYARGPCSNIRVLQKKSGGTSESRNTSPTVAPVDRRPPDFAHKKLDRARPMFLEGRSIKLACCGESRHWKKHIKSALFLTAEQAAERNLPKSFCYHERWTPWLEFSHVSGKNFPNQANETNSTVPLLMIRWRRTVRLKVKPINLSAVLIFPNCTPMWRSSL